MKTEPARTIAELKELRALTGDENGAQRVAFTETWAKARKWLRGKLEAFCPDVRTDEAGNLWATLRGESPKALLIGGHIDSVSKGGLVYRCFYNPGAVGIFSGVNAPYKKRPPVTSPPLVCGGGERGRCGEKLF